jgi:hypothetical protein
MTSTSKIKEQLIKKIIDNLKTIKKNLGVSDEYFDQEFGELYFNQEFGELLWVDPAELEDPV